MYIYKNQWNRYPEVILEELRSKTKLINFKVNSSMLNRNLQYYKTQILTQAGVIYWCKVTLTAMFSIHLISQLLYKHRQPVLGRPQIKDWGMKLSGLSIKKGNHSILVRACLTWQNKTGSRSFKIPPGRLKIEHDSAAFSWGNNIQRLHNQVDCSCIITCYGYILDGALNK